MFRILRLQLTKRWFTGQLQYKIEEAFHLAAFKPFYQEKSAQDTMRRNGHDPFGGEARGEAFEKCAFRLRAFKEASPHDLRGDRMDQDRSLFWVAAVNLKAPYGGIKRERGLKRAYRRKRSRAGIIRRKHKFAWLWRHHAVASCALHEVRGAACRTQDRWHDERRIGDLLAYASFFNKDFVSA
jgi:hypothetical protein